MGDHPDAAPIPRSLRAGEGRQSERPSQCGSMPLDSNFPQLYDVASSIHEPHSPETSAPVAQLDRASDFESGGRPFESVRARQ